jgi:lipopolysaccharide transport system ATP-binding protein
MSTVIEVDDLWKKYRLGVIGTGSLRHDFERWWHRVRGKPDPHSKVDQRSEIRNRKSELATNVDHRISGVSASLGDDEMWALRGVSFEVKQGEILGIIGRNGAGKSTLLKILSRVTAPTSGEVRVKGRIASLLEVGTGFHPELTGRENVFLNGAILGMTKAEIRKKFDEIVDFAGVERYMDTPVKRYSSGMYVRLAFAVAAHLEPEILIVDEVLAVGDAEFQKKCLGKMGDVAHEGRTVLFVSHNMTAILALCDRAILLDDGRVRLDASSELAIPEYLGRASPEESTDYDLTGYKYRQPAFPEIIRKATLRRKNLCKASCFSSEEALVCDINLALPRKISLPRVALGIEDEFGVRICTLASFFGSSKIPALDTESVVRCTVSRLDLGPGKYRLSFSVADSSGKFLDIVENGAGFTVEWTNGFRSGEPYHRVYGPVVKASEWELLD